MRRTRREGTASIDPGGLSDLRLLAGLEGLENSRSSEEGADAEGRLDGLVDNAHRRVENAEDNADDRDDHDVHRRIAITPPLRRLWLAHRYLTHLSCFPPCSMLRSCSRRSSGRDRAVEIGTPVP